MFIAYPQLTKERFFNVVRWCQELIISFHDSLKIQMKLSVNKLTDFETFWRPETAVRSRRAFKNMIPNNICCLGGDFTARTLCCVIAFKCPEVRVTILDNERNTTEWNSDKLPFHEPELVQIIKKCRNRNLIFSSDFVSAIQDSDLIVLAASVPIKTVVGRVGKSLDFKELEDGAKLIALHSESDKIVVEKSEVSARAAEKVSSILQSASRAGVRYQVISNPEFATEGSAASDLLNPERVVIGCQNNPNGKAAAEALCELYERWVPRKKITILNHWSTEVYKLAANAFLAQRLCSINTLAIICEETGADVTEVLNILCRDSRIGSKCLNPSLGFGGFQKDISNLVFICDSLNLSDVAQYWQVVIELNNYQVKRFIVKIKSILGSISSKDITVWGFSYKKNTCDTAFSPAIHVCQWLLKEKSNLRVYDPQVPAERIIKDLELENVDERERNIQICGDPYLSSSGSVAVIICTEKDEFAKLDYSRLAKWMKTPVVIDGRKFLDAQTLKEAGIEYYPIGLAEPKNPTQEETNKDECENTQEVPDQGILVQKVLSEDSEL